VIREPAGHPFAVIAGAFREARPAAIIHAYPELFWGKSKKITWEGLMHRLTMMAGALCVALLTGTGAFAQVAPNPNNPNDVVPEASNPLPYGDPINIETAKKVAAAAVAEAKKRNWNTMCVAVVDTHGELVYFERQDNCQYASIPISQHKARTAARFRRPTLAFENLLGKGDNFAYLTTLDDVIASRGGNLLIVGGKIIGAVGASGGAGSQDDVVSQAGVAGLQ
jgi:glc operon protein GlcG